MDAVNRRFKRLSGRLKSSGRSPSPASTSSHDNLHSGAPQLLTKVSSNSLRTSASVNNNAFSQSSENLSSSHSLSIPLAVQPSVSPSPSQASISNPLPAIIISEAAPVTTATEQVSTPPLNLWNDVFEKVNEETKKWIRTHHLDSTEHSQPGSQIIGLAALLQSKTLADDKDTPSNIVIGDRTIVFREYVQGIVGTLSTIGDVAMNFAPPMANAPWAAVKVLLNVRLLVIY